MNKLLTLSGGLRWEAQNHIADHSDWAPRVAFAYALDGHKKGHHDQDRAARRIRFLLRPIRYWKPDEPGTAERRPGESQTQTIISDPTCFSGTSLSSIGGGVASCGTRHSGANRTIYCDFAQLSLALSRAARHEPGATSEQSRDGDVHVHAHIWFSPAGGARLKRVFAGRLSISNDPASRRHSPAPRPARSQPGRHRAILP